MWMGGQAVQPSQPSREILTATSIDLISWVGSKHNIIGRLGEPSQESGHRRSANMSEKAIAARPFVEDYRFWSYRFQLG
jgi:hypothetical protein